MEAFVASRNSGSAAFNLADHVIVTEGSFVSDHLGVTARGSIMNNLGQSMALSITD